MKKKLIAFLTFFIALIPAFAQMSTNPSHPFYTAAQSWNSRGIVESLPLLRPYSVKNIKAILETVIERGGERDANAAKDYWEELTGRPWNVSAEADIAYSNKAGEAPVLTAIYPALNGDVVFFGDFVSFGYKMGFAARTDIDEMKFFPMYTRSEHDSIQDPASADPFKIYLDVDDCIAVGTQNVFLQAGIYRSGYGTFLGEGVALNDSSYHAGNISFSYRGKRFSYSQQISAVGATSSYDGRLSSLAADKVLAFHAAEFRFTPKVSLSYFETVMYGPRFDFSYLAPTPYMVVQGIGGCNDNLQMGLSLHVRPIKGLLWATDFYVDDIDVNKLLKLNADSKNRIAAKTGISYYSENRFIPLVDASYTLITPYTYSHWDYDDYTVRNITSNTVNYQDYTNNGISMGSSLPPNSESITLRAEFTPLPGLDISLHGLYARHANICETLTTDEALTYLSSPAGVYSTDGGIHTHSMFTGDKTIPTAWNALNFLTQEHKMHIVQAGLSGSYTLPKFRFGKISIKFAYTFEFVHNAGVDTALYPGLGDSLVKNEDGSFIYEGTTYATEDSLVEFFKETWIQGLRDEFNHYVSMGLSYRF